jgi:hypothetical protein
VNIQTLETRGWAVESIHLGCPRMPERGPGAKAMLLPRPFLTGAASGIFRRFWGLGEAASRRRSAARSLRAAQPPQRAAAQVSGAQCTPHAFGDPRRSRHPGARGHF